jgi:predicted TIM-barrel fold metal-dependent hydrolase
VGVINVAVWVGQYPFRGIPGSDVAALKRKMSELRIDHAIVAPFEGIFWENSLDAYERTVDKLGGEQTLEVWPVVRPEPTAGLEELLERHRPRGMRLLPNYHRYRVSHPAVAKLMELARERGMIVQVFQRIADERWHYMLHVPPVPQEDMEYLTAVYHDQPVLLSGVQPLAFLASRLREQPMLYADLSRVRGPQFAIETLVKTLPVEKLIFGSLWPIQIIEATLWQVTTAKIDVGLKRRILRDNAEELLAKARRIV